MQRLQPSRRIHYLGCRPGDARTSARGLVSQRGDNCSRPGSRLDFASTPCGRTMTASPLRRLLASRLLYVFLGLALPGALAAQGTSTLTGRVVDSTGAPIRGATVRVPQLGRAAKADSPGQFKLDGLPTGRVTIVGEAPGFVGKRADV